MERLFCVKDSKSKKVDLITLTGAPYKHGKYVDCKKHAKWCRDEFGGVEKGFRVSRGPDHIGKHGHTIPRMRRQPQHRRTS